MTTTTPQSDGPDSKAEIIDEIKRIVPILSTQFSDIMKNIQWYSTIVVAEIAGVAKLTSTSHGWIFALYIISILFLFISIGSLVYSNVRAQDIKISIESYLMKLISDISNFDFKKSNSMSEVKDLKEILKEFYGLAQDSDPQVYSRIGLFSFLLGSIFGGLGILFS